MSRSALFGALAMALLLAAAQIAPAQSPASYDSSIALIARRQAGDDQIADPSARSILLTHGAPTPRAFVLLHGLTDSPRQFEALAYRLHAEGNNVFVPRFPQHGLRSGDARALARLTASQLRSFADSVASDAAGLGDSVVVVGLSMGANVAAWLAQERTIARAVLIAPALEPGHVPRIFDKLIVGLVDRLPNLTRRSPSDPARPDREPGFSTRAIAEIFELGRAVLRDAAHATPPTRQMVVLVNANDRTVRESAATALARNWSRHGAAVSVVELPDQLRLPHNIVDPVAGTSIGDGVLDLVRELAYGGQSPPLVRSLPVR